MQRKRPRILTPNAKTEGRTLKLSLLVGIVSLGLGLLAARASMDHLRGEEAAATLVAPSVSRKPREAGDQDKARSAETAPMLQQEDDKQREQKGDSQAIATPTGGTEALGSGEFSIQPGRVAYYLCPGLEQANKRCPRDKAFEMKVWRTLWRMQHCSTAQAQVGRGEIELDFRSTRAPSLRIEGDGASTSTSSKEPKATVPISRGVFESCLGERIKALKHNLATPHLRVSFRYDVIEK